MISGPSAFHSIRRFAQVRFLAVVGLLSIVTVPAWAADEESAPTVLPNEQTVQQPVAAGAPAVDESLTAQIVQAEFTKLMTTVVNTAQTFANSVVKADGTQNAEVAKSSEPASVEPAKQASAPVSDIKVKEAEIDSIAAQIEEEKFRSAQRIADLQSQLSAAQEKLTAITSVDTEGFIRGWLVMGPIAVDEKVSNHDEESDKEFLDRNYVPAGSMPKDGDTASIDNSQRSWKTVHSSDYFVDLARVANDQELDAEHAAFLGVAYVTSDDQISNVKLSIGSDDDSVWRLNGKEVIRSYSGRGVEKDQDSAEALTLKQGVNVISFTVLNGTGATGAAARFVGEDGSPIKGLKVSLTPPPTTQPIVQVDNSELPGIGQPVK